MAKAILYGGADLYPKQREAIFDQARISIIEANPKAGKTVACLAWLFEQAIKGRPGNQYWWLAPVFSQSEIGFRRMAAKIPVAYRKPNQSKLTLKLVNETTIWFKSADRPEDLFGEDVYAAVLDEASRMREEAWGAVATTLTYTKGPVRIIGNVRGTKNWFYKLARVAEKGGDPEMSYHRITAKDAAAAGVLDPEEIERARQRYANLGKEGLFKQLYEAEAHDESDNPFGLAAIEACVITGETMVMKANGECSWDNPAAAYPRAAGVDLAGRGANNLNAPNATEIERDFTAVVLLDREGTVTHVSRFRADHAATQERVLRTVGSAMALVDSTGAGDQQVEAMQKRVGPRVEGYIFSQRSRQDLLEGLALAIAEGRIRFPDGPLRDELDAFEFGYTRTGERWEVPAGEHDDLVFALALAVKRLPFRRGSAQTPIGVRKPGGSLWTPESARAEPSLLGDTTAQQPPLEEEQPVGPVPILVRGRGFGGGSRWRGADS